MQLKLKTRVTYYVDAFDLAEYISHKAGRGIEFIDTRNDTDYSRKIVKEELDDWGMKDVDNMLNHGWISCETTLRNCLTHCANQGWLEEGDYVIQVSW